MFAAEGVHTAVPQRENSDWEEVNLERIKWVTDLENH